MIKPGNIVWTRRAEKTKSKKKYGGIKMTTNKMILDQTWKNCLRMWKWIAETWKPGMNVCTLKRQWLKKFWKKEKNPHVECFFCEYNQYNLCNIRGVDDPFHSGCQQCPGILVSTRFHCGRTTYYYRDKPKKFYQKLLQLDVKRRKRRVE